MKLGMKMFFCITIFFSAAFLSCGAILISVFYETAIEKEIESTSQQYQYNKFVVQAALITRENSWIADAADGLSSIDFIAADMNGTAALFSLDHTELFSGFPDQADFSGLLDQAGTDIVNYQFMEIQNRMYLLIIGSVKQKDTGVYLITGVDVQDIQRQQELLLQKFGSIYAAALCIGIVLIIGLSILLTRPIKRLSDATQKIAAGNYAQRVAESGNDEVGQLARHFNQMACAIEDKINELSESARQKEDFAANLAHELKTPLTSVIGYADRIYKKDLPRDAQKQAAWHIWNEGMRLEALSLKLMDLTVLNHKEFVLQEMDASQMLAELSSDLEYLMKEKNICYHYTAQQAYIKAEYDLFKTLFLNIIDNAQKAGATQIRVTGHTEQSCTHTAYEPESHIPDAYKPNAYKPNAYKPNAYKQNSNIKESVHDSIKIDEASKTDRSDYCALRYIIQIEDNGCGIPPDEIKRITEAFYMVDKSRSRKLHGAGLGLALAQKIAEVHKASLAFDSDGASGTTVTIDLAAAPFLP